MHTHLYVHVLLLNVCVCRCKKYVCIQMEEQKRSHHAGVTKVRNAPECPTYIDSVQRMFSFGAFLIALCWWVVVGIPSECSCLADNVVNNMQQQKERSTTYVQLAIINADILPLHPHPVRQPILPLLLYPCLKGQMTPYSTYVRQRELPSQHYMKQVGQVNLLLICSSVVSRVYPCG